MNKSLVVKSAIVLVIGLAVGAYLASSLGFANFLLQNSYATGGGNIVTICHATESEENPWTRIVVSENAIGGHFENHGTPKAGHEDDLLLDGEVDCPQPEEDEQELQPEPETGSITVCKIVASDEGVISDGEEVEGSFEIAGIEVVDHETVPDSTGVLPTSAFTVPLTLNTNLIGDDTNDAECVTYSDLELGSYFYDEEVVSGDNWDTPTYNDQIFVEVGSLSDFFVYSGELFTEDSSDDSSRDKNADGHIVLTESRPHRTLVVLNIFIEDEEPIRQCSDGIDNDEDGLIDSEDPGCHTDGDPENSESYDPEDNDETDTNGGGGDFPRFGSVNGDSGGFTPDGDEDEGEVLGEETTCGIYLFEFIRLGRSNNPTEVMKLETFLNEFQGENLTVDGFYSQEDFAAVERFQVTHWENVLAPWVPHGLDTAKTPTGYVYKTTMRWINVLKCPSLELELPVLP